MSIPWSYSSTSLRVRLGARAARSRWHTLGAVTASLALVLPLFARGEISEDPLLGAGVRSRPAYDGSSSQVTEAIPVIRYLGSPWFVRTTQEVLEGGVRTLLAPELHVAAQLAYEPGRLTNESDFLQAHRLPFVDRGFSVGAQLEWDHLFGPMPVSVLARVRQDVDLSQGAQMDLRLNAGVFQQGPFAAGVFTQLTWANAKSTDTFYGISPQESVVTGLAAFSPGGGWLFSSFGLLGSFDLSSRWTLVGGAETQHLHGEAARSPLSQMLANAYLSLGLAYRF